MVKRATEHDERHHLTESQQLRGAEKIEEEEKIEEILREQDKICSLYKITQEASEYHVVDVFDVWFEQEILLTIVQTSHEPFGNREEIIIEILEEQERPPILFQVSDDFGNCQSLKSLVLIPDHHLFNNVALARFLSTSECGVHNKERHCLSYRRGLGRFKISHSTLILVVLFSVTLTGSCASLSQPVIIVPECPTSEGEWEVRARAFNCNSLFSYHCMINEKIQELVEVCAEVQHSRGFCPEYNIIGRTIQDNYRVDCKNHKPPCPKAFMSNEVFKYPSCFMTNKPKKTNETQIETETDKDIKDVDKLQVQTTLIIIVSISAVIVISPLSFILCCTKLQKKGFLQNCSCKRQSKNSKYTTDTEHSETEESKKLNWRLEKTNVV